MLCLSLHKIDPRVSLPRPRDLEWNSDNISEPFWFCRIREAQAAIDARNLKYKSDATKSAQKSKKDGSEGESRELSERLSSAEKAVEKFVAKRIQPAVRKVILSLRVAHALQSNCLSSTTALSFGIYLLISLVDSNSPSTYRRMLPQGSCRHAVAFRTRCSLQAW